MNVRPTDQHCDINLDMDTEQQILHTTMRIEVIDGQGRQFFGTAFMYQHPLGDNKELPLLVSNKHVFVENARKITATALKKGANDNPSYGNSVTFDLRCLRCGNYHVVGHPKDEIDVAAINVGYQLNLNPIFFRAVGPENILKNQPEDKGLKKATLESVFFIGYPNGIYDTHNVMPIARFGRLATLLDFEYLGHPQFLIDAAVFGGSSGSPVFVYRKFQRSSSAGIFFGEEPYFVGVLAAVHQKSDHGRLVPVNYAIEIDKELGLGLVFNESTVTDVATLAHNKFVTDPHCG